MYLDVSSVSAISRNIIIGYARPKLRRKLIPKIRFVGLSAAENATGLKDGGCTTRETNLGTSIFDFDEQNLGKINRQKKEQLRHAREIG